jgi:Metallo-peptidase family M12B Reprolysin-like
MISLREISTCVGLTGGFSVVRDFFGYRQIRFAFEVSLLSQARLLRGPHIHLNFIQVGSELFTDSIERNVDRGLLELREIYAQVGVGVGRVEHFAISVAQADGAEEIADHDEGRELMENWSVPNNGIDIFLVIDIEGVHGFSPIGGPCDKDDKWSGVVIVAGHPLLGRNLAHEIGHYLGLEHVEAKGNVMEKDEFDMGEDLTAGQGEVMRAHCMMRPGCVV